MERHITRRCLDEENKIIYGTAAHADVMVTKDGEVVVRH